jgi:hypothetical protein
MSTVASVAHRHGPPPTLNLVMPSQQPLSTTWLLAMRTAGIPKSTTSRSTTDALLGDVDRRRRREAKIWLARLQVVEGDFASAVLHADAQLAVDDRLEARHAEPLACRQPDDLDRYHEGGQRHAVGIADDRQFLVGGETVERIAERRVLADDGVAIGRGRHRRRQVAEVHPGTAAGVDDPRGLGRQPRNR